ncbi:MAG: molybdopterin cofactor-binding domain-containing protein [Pseudomonadota bacterium]
MHQAFDSRRRDVLKAGAAAGAGLTLAFWLPGFTRFAEAMSVDAPAAAGTFRPNAFLRIAPDGSVTVLVGKSEMGQGVLTALPQIVAEELDADWSRVRYRQAPTHPDYARPGINIMLTGGSTSVRTSWEALRRAGATARAMLVAAAAQTWRADAARLRTEAGRVIHPDGRKLAYGELAERAATLPVPAPVKLKDPAQFRLVGRSVARLDTRAKVDGSAQFGLDVQLPGMLTAVLERPPVFGASVAGFDAEQAKAVPGVKHVVPISSGVAVVADGFWAAEQGRRALAIDWTPGVVAGLSTETLWREFARAIGKPAIPARQEGSVSAVQPAKTVRAAYAAPYLAHACMEPMNCTAWVKVDEAEIWAGTQSQTIGQRNVAQLTGLPPEKVKLHTTLLGGGFGRRSAQDFIVAAAEISKAVGAPVKLVYTREDDMRSGYFRPASYTVLEGGLDAAGKPVMLKGTVAVPSLAEFTGFRRLMNEQGVDRVAVEGLADLPYAIPYLRIDWVKHDPGVPIWFWRSVGASHNTFVSESFIDELAHAAGQDPLAFRLALLGRHPRHIGVLKLAAEKAGWGRPLPAGWGRGIAVTECFGGRTAQVAEVSVRDGAPRVERIVAAVDAGTVVNPEIVRAQTESSVAYGLSATLYGEITFKDGRVEQTNFHDYRVLTIAEMPKVEVHLVPSTAPPGGVGEPGLPPVAPAVANAFFAASGKRIRRLPFAAGLKEA